MKKITLVVLLLSLIQGAFAQGQCDCRGSNTLDISTGLDTSGNLISVPSGSVGGAADPYWQLVNVAPPSVNGSVGISVPKTYAIAFNGAGDPSSGLTPIAWLYIPGAQAISVIPNYNFSTNNSVGQQPWRFVRKFFLCPNASNTHTVNFSVVYLGDDNAAVKIFDSTGALRYSAPGADWLHTHPFNTDIDMPSGCGYVTVELKNTDHVDMGFTVKAILTDRDNSNSLSNPTQVCCGSSIISVQKIIDANCNGQYDAGELPGVGWTFNLLSGSSIVQPPATTDANGEFTFYNVPYGTYTLQEVSQAGFTPSNPSNGQYTVVTSAANPVQTFLFLNCNRPPPPVCPCDGTATVDQSSPSVVAQNNSNNANPISTATTSFTVTSSVPVSEVRVLIDEFRLTTASGNENCILCRNKPQTWANINSGSLSGVTSQTTANPSTLERDIRELVFNNGPGTVFNLNGNILNLTLGLPGVTGLDCCTLKAEVCVKFIIRDVNCCEREIEKCFTFNVQ